MERKKKKQIFIAFTILAIVTFGVGIYTTGFIREPKVENFAREGNQTPKVISTTTTAPCPLSKGPDGSLVPLCEVNIISDDLLLPSPDGDFNLDPGMSLSAGTGTTTLKKATPFNDILIAETNSPYASLRNARYTVWPYPGETPIKEIYLILPEDYEPIFPGYSNNQFIELIDGTKHLMLYLRHKQSVTTGADARVFIQSPSPTNEPDQPLGQFDSTDSWAGFSQISNGQEVLVEVSFSNDSSTTSRVSDSARQELLRAIKNMEIIW